MAASWRTGRWIAVGAAVGLLGAAVMAATSSPSAVGQAKTSVAKYIGSAKCKNCHANAAHGDQFARWKEAKHSHAFASLATPEALAAGKERGVAKPQEDAACLKCHSTAYGEAAERFAKGFDMKEGVGCESCHGPGEAHLKARMAAAAEAGEEEEGFGDEAPALQAIPAGEIVARPTVDLCVKCHNKESPTFKPFCMKVRVKEIAHFDPRKKRTPEQLEAKDYACLPDCEQCKAGGK